MSKKENKRYTDKDRKTAPKRGGKNRRDYGEGYTYEPKRSQSKPAGRRTAAPASSGARKGGQRRNDARKVLGFDLDEQEGPVIGSDGLEVIAGRNPENVSDVSADINDDSKVDIADVIMLANMIINK